MQDLIYFAFVGVDHVDWVLLINRSVVGLFFLISGFHKLFVAERHRQLVVTLEECGIPCIAFNQWFVPAVEFLGGAAVLLGILAPFAALGLLTILIVAICTDGPRKIRAYKPLNRADAFDCFLYLPETVYAVMLLFVIAPGPGSFSLHWYILPYVVST